MLPKDLWKVKAIVSGGMDTSIYKDQIAYYWGPLPFEQYGSTEEGAVATQIAGNKGMTFFPDAAFLEFIPEEQWARWRRDPSYHPSTVLMDEVEPGKRYEVVITNLYGKPLVRYRMHDLIEITSLHDNEIGINLPQMVFVGRSSDFIDLAGFTGMIDEKLVWRAVLGTKIKYEEWTIRKEIADGNPFLHLYIELKENVDRSIVEQKVHESLKALNPFYADYEAMIEKKPLQVTLLAPGTFQAYMREMHRSGADLAHLKPPHMNASDSVMKLLLSLHQSLHSE
jgi:phenylacetate-coenzyme A ligase PaaK-like adenylate-forming protein